MFTYDAAAPTQGGGFSLLPEGTYDLVITKVEEKKSAAGDPMVNVTCEVRNNPDYNGSKVFHNVTFMKKDKAGAGMATHFLKCIKQPWDGAINVDPDTWAGEDFTAKIAPREYKKKDGTMAKTNNIVEVMPTHEEKIPF